LHWLEERDQFDGSEGARIRELLGTPSTVVRRT
jgi:hypothetical protein